MGGNVTSRIKKTGEETRAEKIPLKDIGRKEFINKFVEIFKVLNKNFKKKNNRPIWVDEKLLSNGFVFNGSTSFIMDPSLSDEEVVKYKPSAGDLDIALPENLKIDVWHFLDNLEGKEIIPGVKYMGSNKMSPSAIGDQINTVFIVDFGNVRAKCQVDFEFLPFEENKPSDWAKFSHSSSFADAKAGVKAVAHKFLIRALVGGASVREDIVIATTKSTPDKIILSKSKIHLIPRMLKFSVARGIRVAYEPMLDNNGQPIYVDGKEVYKEIPSKDSTYETVIENIYKLAFQQLIGHEQDVRLFNSFVGVLELMKKYLDKKQIQNTHERFIDLLWSYKGQIAQELEVGNAELDFQIKNAAYQKMIKYLGLPDKSNKMVEMYYKDYGRRRKVRESFRGLLENITI